MRLQRIGNVLFSVLFTASILFGMVYTSLKPKETLSFFENRDLARVPVLNRDSFIDGSWFSGWETYLKDHALGRETLMRLSAAVELFVLNKPVVNNIVVTKNTLLNYNAYRAPDNALIARQSQAMTDDLQAFNLLVNQYGGIFFYVTVPTQTTYFANDYPNYLSNDTGYADAVITQFTSDMFARHVPVIDLGQVYDEMGHPHNFYSTTDHHYTLEGAFAGYEAIMARINGARSWQLPVLTPDTLTMTAQPNPFLGSRARKIYNLVPKDDKLKIGSLRQDIPFTRTDDGNPSPSFIYSLPGNAWETLTYTVYMGGDVSETVINTHRPGLPNVLICGDSYTNAMECLLYTSFNEMRSLDLRGYTDKTLADYVKTYKPDVVILLRDYSVLLTKGGNGSVFGEN